MCVNGHRSRHSHNVGGASTLSNRGLPALVLSASKSSRQRENSALTVALTGHRYEHYNRARPHRGLHLDKPVPHSTTTVGGKVIRRDVLAGVIHEYEFAP